VGRRTARPHETGPPDPSRDDRGENALPAARTYRRRQDGLVLLSDIGQRLVSAAAIVTSGFATRARETALGGWLVIAIHPRSSAADQVRFWPTATECCRRRYWGSARRRLAGTGRRIMTCRRSSGCRSAAALRLGLGGPGRRTAGSSSRPTRRADVLIRGPAGRGATPRSTRPGRPVTRWRRRTLGGPRCRLGERLDQRRPRRRPRRTPRTLNGRVAGGGVVAVDQHGGDPVAESHCGQGGERRFALDSGTLIA